MNRAARVALIAGAGYLIGRRRKLALTLALGAAAATGRASAKPGGLLGRGAELIRSSPQLGRVADLGAPLAAAGRAAASSVAMSTVDSVSERLRDRTEALRQAGPGQTGPPPRGQGGAGDRDRGRRGEQDRDRDRGGEENRDRESDQGAGRAAQQAGERERPARPVARRSSARSGTDGAPVRRRGR